MAGIREIFSAGSAPKSGRELTLGLVEATALDDIALTAMDQRLPNDAVVEKIRAQLRSARERLGEGYGSFTENLRERAKKLDEGSRQRIEQALEQ